ncbi:MAG: hypothetical protein GW778_07210 [Alphaproteobacteria bacterium]|nr:hypothetical protein [Alphaproteobacteria bacterium]
MQCIDNIEKKLNTIATSLTGLQREQSWPCEELLNQAVYQTQNFLHPHLEKLQNTAQILLETTEGAHSKAVDVETLFRAWHMDKNPPSLLSLCIFLLEHLAVKPSPDDANMLIVSAILGQIHNEPAYHNDMHFRKVLSQAIRLIIVNNDIYEGTSRALDTKQICTLLSAACIHDLDHDGQGNVVKGIHIEGRAEKHSYNIVKPYLAAAGCDDETLKTLLTMLLTTDVSPLDDPTNPMMQMKAAYRFHFLGEKIKAHSLNLSTDIRALEKDPALTTLCMLLHEADIATSAGVTYDVTKYETTLIMEEFKDDKAYPSDVVTFLDQVCHRRFLSAAALKLYAGNMARICALAEQDVKNGNEAYGPSNLSNFLMPHAEHSNNKTLN